jgi:hypothetical protein
MADPPFTDADLAVLLEGTKPAPLDVEGELAALLGEGLDVIPAAPASAAMPTPMVSEPATEGIEPAPSAPTPAGKNQDEYAWLRALHLAPQYQRLILRYPAIGLMQHDQHDLVLVAAYLEDVRQRIRRNLKLGDDLFFHAPEIEVFEPDTKKFGCRIMVKIMRHQVGMRIRYWENRPQGDVLGKTGIYEVREKGLTLVHGSRR